MQDTFVKQDRFEIRHDPTCDLRLKSKAKRMDMPFKLVKLCQASSFAAYLSTTSTVVVTVSDARLINLLRRVSNGDTVVRVYRGL
jgi:hypothetical protein